MGRITISKDPAYRTWLESSEFQRNPGASWSATLGTAIQLIENPVSREVYSSLTNHFCDTKLENVFKGGTVENEKLQEFFRDNHTNIAITHFLLGDPKKEEEKYLVEVRIFGRNEQCPHLCLVAAWDRDGDLAFIEWLPTLEEVLDIEIKELSSKDPPSKLTPEQAQALLSCMSPLRARHLVLKNQDVVLGNYYGGFTITDTLTTSRPSKEFMYLSCTDDLHKRQDARKVWKLLNQLGARNQNSPTRKV